MSKLSQQALSMCLSALFTLSILGGIDLLAQNNGSAAQMAMKAPATAASSAGA